MEPIYQQTFSVTDNCVDCFGHLKPSALLYFSQEVAGQHCLQLGADYDTLSQKGLFWAIIRNRISITRMPMAGETIRLETWPMPTTRVAYPRAVTAYDEAGNECFRTVSLWVLMDSRTRTMVLPKKSGVEVNGILRGTELAVPPSILPKELLNHRSRAVSFTDLDRNGHMNNTRYLDWLDDLLPGSFHRDHKPKEVTVCYLSESLEGQTLELCWDILEDGALQVEALRQTAEKTERVFSARVFY